MLKFSSQRNNAPIPVSSVILEANIFKPGTSNIEEQINNNKKRIERLAKAGLEIRSKNDLYLCIINFLWLFVCVQFVQQRFSQNKDNKLRIYHTQECTC